jgi:hypothetical protein
VPLINILDLPIAALENWDAAEHFSCGRYSFISGKRVATPLAPAETFEICPISTCYTHFPEQHNTNSSLLSSVASKRPGSMTSYGRDSKHNTPCRMRRLAAAARHFLNLLI